MPYRLACCILVAALWAISPAAAPAAAFAAGRASNTASLSANGSLPEFRLTRLDGSTIGPADLAGRIVVLDFWATWCAPCRIQHRILAAAYDDLKERGVEVLGVDYGEDAATVRSYRPASPIPYPLVVDEGGKLALGLEVVALPTLIVVGPEGRIATARVGVTSPEILERTIDRLLSQTAAPAPTAADG